MLSEQRHLVSTLFAPDLARLCHTPMTVGDLDLRTRAILRQTIA